ncbi:uncharacterized protein TNCV_2844721 [Trichonephila clavipes]|nr:uncharacterized protein TNCV_2844721 [Trichonephila clavipes]
MSESGPSVIQRLQDQIKLKDTESRSHDFGRPHIITFAADRFLTFSDPRRTATANVANHFIASGTRISATTVFKPLHSAYLFVRRPVVYILLKLLQRCADYVGQENTFPAPDNNELLFSSQMTPF